MVVVVVAFLVDYACASRSQLCPELARVQSIRRLLGHAHALPRLARLRRRARRLAAALRVGERPHERLSLARTRRRAMVPRPVRPATRSALPSRRSGLSR